MTLDELDKLVAEKVFDLLSRHGHNIKFPKSKNGCWEWVGCLDRDGYGRASTGKNSDGRAHRLFYQVFKGDMGGLVTDHLCRQRNCVNPSHLELVTIAENNKRGNHPIQVAKRKNQCVNGHNLTPETTYVQKHKDRKWTGCLLCRQNNSAKNRQRRLKLGLK